MWHNFYMVIAFGPIILALALPLPGLGPDIKEVVNWQSPQLQIQKDKMDINEFLLLLDQNTDS